MKDLQKSRALQACRLLIDAFDKAYVEPGGFARLVELRDAYDAANLAVGKKGAGAH